MVGVDSSWFVDCVDYVDVWIFLEKVFYGCVVVFFVIVGDVVVDDVFVVFVVNFVWVFWVDVEVDYEVLVV